jgi:hydroxymethylpyrimidine/phosphomethylpyrimidine kinase
MEVAPGFVAQQIDAVFDDFAVAAAKTGMLATPAIIEAVAERLRARAVGFLVVDPVMVATSGDRLQSADALEALRRRLLPLAALITPNLHEAGVLLGRSIGTAAEMRDAARALVDLGPRAALVKGGHRRAADGTLAPDALDVLFDGTRLEELSAPRAGTRAVHGAGCTLSAAIAAGVARGHALADAVRLAKDYVRRAIESAPGLGAGATPLDHDV